MSGGGTFPGWKRCFLQSILPDLPIKGFLETSFIDWREQLAAVLFTGGCNFRCPFCHNRDLVLEPQSIENISPEYIFERLTKFRKWVGRVVITGGEPTIHPGLVKAIEQLKERGLKVKLDTNGSRPEVIRQLVRNSMLDYIAMDVKGPIDMYERWSGVAAEKDKIRESVDLILEGHVDFEFRMTLVPFLHREQDAFQVAEYVKSGKRFFLQEFIPRDTLDPRYSGVRPFSAEKMRAIRETVQNMLADAPINHHLHR